MKSEFAEFFPFSKPQIKVLKEEGLFAFDANILLHLYRYSERTVQALMSALQELGDRLWLPHQAALEFHQNRPDTLLSTAKTYADAATSLRKLLAQFEEDHHHPFLSEAALDDLRRSINAADSEIGTSRERFLTYRDEDPILSFIGELFDGRVGPPFSHDELESIYKEGRQRYSEKRPPGYKDAEAKAGNRVFGDLVLWKQCLAKAHTDKKPIVLVSDDKKPDWWTKPSGGVSWGPRPELIREMQETAEQPFHMYTMEGFLKENNFEVEPVVISEVKSVARDGISYLRRRRNNPSPSGSKTLRDHEVDLLAKIADESFSLSDGAPLYSVKNAFESSGYTATAFLLAQKRLENGRLIETFEDSDERGEPYAKFRISDSGLAWLESNADRAPLKRPTRGSRLKSSPPSTDDGGFYEDDLPF